MNVTRWMMVATLAVLATSGPARADEKLDTDTMQAFGGTYLSDCKNNASPRVTVFEDALVFLAGTKRVAGKNVMSAASFYGDNNDDPKFRTVILSELPDGSQFLYKVSQDEKGYYITLDGDTKAMAQVPATARGLVYRRCDAAPPAAPKAAAPSPVGKAAPAAPEEMPSAPALLGDASFKAVYRKALGRLAKEDWLTALDGPSPAMTKATIGGVEYTVANACKNHDCFDNNTTLFYSAAKKVVYGKVLNAGKSSLIGNPPPAVAKELGAVWFKEWRQGK
ncbi:MAG: Ivy family c-type lysozyme inhibitor [Candidatus Eisenbacteria bacterium]